MNSTAPSASVPRPRILTIDVLRGVALFGILYAHMVFWYSGGALPEKIYQAYLDTPTRIAITINTMLFSAKIFSLFSFLFGLGFYLQMKSFAGKVENATLRFGWRLLVLGVIGIIHHAFWRSDILTIYVPLGFLLLLLRNFRNKSIAILAAMLILNLPTKIIEAVSIFVQGTPEFIANHFIENGLQYYKLMTEGSFSDVVIENIFSVQEKFEYQVSSGRIFITFGFMLFGMLAGRFQLFEDMNKFRAVFKDLWGKYGSIIISVVVIRMVFGFTLDALPVAYRNLVWVHWLRGLMVDVFNVSVPILYIVGIPLLMQKEKWLNRLSLFSYIGRMSLTSYITQSFFGVILFFHFGFGLFLATSPAVNAGLCFIVFGVQVILCKIWLQYFNYGPIEWLWRSATYLKWQPIVSK